MAQPGSALRSGRRGPQFKSGHPDRLWGWRIQRFPERDACRFYPRCVLRAVVFDVDFTLARPGPDLGPDGYRALGLRYGLELDPSRYDEARAAAFSEVKRHPELDHDEEIWVLFTERIILGMGGRGDTYAAAVEMERRWAHSVHFELYDDALPALAACGDMG